MTEIEAGPDGAFDGRLSCPERASEILSVLRNRTPSRPIRIMNVCGSHEREVASLGLRRVLPAAFRLIPGPGCPVCVCPESDLRAAVELLSRPGIRMAVFGDLVRVPLSKPCRGIGSLQEASAAGGRLHVVASPLEVSEIARSHPAEEIVFFSAGFETTTAPLVALVEGGLPENLSLLLSHKRTSPAVRALLESGDPGFDALIAPGHVTAVTGPEEWAFVPRDHGLPATVCGFYDVSLLAGILSLKRQVEAGEARLENLYGRVVRPGGNRRALEMMDRVFEVGPAVWRGVGTLPESGYRLREAHGGADARVRHGLEPPDREEPMPEGCECHHVFMGRKAPSDCGLFGKACTPAHPVGPCMVSGEGACRIWIREEGH